MRFCSVDNVGIVLDTFAPKMEERHDTEVRVIVLTLRIEPLTLAIATSIDSLLRRMLFVASSGECVPQTRDVVFAFDVPRQLLQVRLSPDGNGAGAMLLDQVQIGHLRAKQDKDGKVWSLTFKASVGPVSRDELNYLQNWFATQRFVTFTPAEADLFEHADDQVEELADAAQPPPPPKNRRRAPTTH
jgi:hypothetical protein